MGQFCSQERQMVYPYENVFNVPHNLQSVKNNAEREKDGDQE